ALAATADGMSIAVGYSSGTIDIHCADTLAVRSTLPARPNAVSRLAYSPSGNYLAVGEAQGRIAVLDAAAGAVKFSQFTYHTGRITALDWSANGTLLASGSLDTNIYVWN
ncbi:WD40 repeat-like protein, partial [Ramicandelaber brevisporus]